MPELIFTPFKTGFATRVRGLRILALIELANSFRGLICYQKILIGPLPSDKEQGKPNVVRIGVLAAL